MRKNIFFIVFIILCAVSCTEKKSNFINMVHLKGQLFDMGSQNVRMRFDGAASMLGDSRDILFPLKRWLTAWPLYVCIHWIR